MQLACPPSGVSLPQRNRRVHLASLQAIVFDMVWGTKIRALMGPKGSFEFLFMSFLSPSSGIRVSRMVGVAECLRG